MSRTLFSLAGFQVIISGRFWGSSAHLVKGEDERVGGGTSSVSWAMRKYCRIRVSWVAEVIFRFAYEPVAVAVPRGNPGGAADC
jgi:hypothetical protein